MAETLITQSDSLTKVLEWIKTQNTLLKNGKLIIPSEPSAYTEWYDKNKETLKTLSSEISKVTEGWNTFIWQNANDINAIQGAEKQYDALPSPDKKIVDQYRKASTVAATLVQIQSKIQPSNYDDSKVVRNITGTKIGLMDKKFIDDSTLTEAWLASLKRLWKIGTDSLGQEYHMVNYGGDKFGVLRIPKDDWVAQIAWLNGADLQNAQKGKYKSIRDTLSKLPYANAELDGSSILLNPTTILSSITAHGKDSLEVMLATGWILALEQALVTGISKAGWFVSNAKIKALWSMVHKALETVWLGSKWLKWTALTVAIWATITYVVGILATDRTLTRTDLRESGFFQNGPTESTDESNNTNSGNQSPEIEITL